MRGRKDRSNKSPGDGLRDEDFEMTEGPKKGGFIKKIALGVVVVVVLGVAALNIVNKVKPGTQGNPPVSQGEDEDTSGVLLENSPVPVNIIGEDIKTHIVSNMPELVPEYEDQIDSVKILEIHPHDKIKEEYAKIIESKTQGNAKSAVLRVKANASSGASNVNILYDVVYLDYADKWHLLHAEPIEVDEWSFHPNEGVGTKGVLDALRAMDFEGFEKGYIGDLEKSSVKIIDSNLDKENKTENMKVKIVVDTDFAEYIFDDSLTFKFDKEGWRIDTVNPDKDIVWDIKFKTPEEPTTHTTEHIMGIVSNEDSYFSRVINFENVKDYTLNDPYLIPNQFGVSIKYKLNVEYQNLAIISYDISIPVEWTGASWVDKSPQIDINSAVLGNSLGLWFSKDTGDILMIEKTEPHKDPKGREFQKITGRLFQRGEDLKLTEYPISITPDFPLRADAFIGKVDGNTESKYKSKDVLFNLQNKTIKIDESSFEKLDEKLGFSTNIDIDEEVREGEKMHDIKDINNKNESKDKTKKEDNEKEDKDKDKPEIKKDQKETKESLDKKDNK